MKDTEKYRRQNLTELDPVENWRRAALREQDRRIRYALHYLIPHPIKGEVTEGKIRYRGIYIAANPQPFDVTFTESDDGPRIECKFHFNYICGKASRSGKRQAFCIDLDFYDRTLWQYEFFRQKEIAEMTWLLSSRHDDKYITGGITNQITKG